MSSELQLLISVSGIYFFYLYYGILQEKIWTTQEDDGQRFTFMLFLLLVQCLVNSFVAFMGVVLFDKPAKGRIDMSSVGKTAPSYLKTIVPNLSGNLWMSVMSFTYLAAMGASNQALSYVSYPTQALGPNLENWRKSMSSLPSYAKNFAPIQGFHNSDMFKARTEWFKESIQETNLDEAVATMRKTMEATDDSPANKDIDANGDGEISYEEYKQYLLSQ